MIAVNIAGSKLTQNEIDSLMSESGKIRCSFCSVELSGGLDTFGDFHEPLCATCFLSGVEMEELSPEVKRILGTVDRKNKEDVEKSVSRLKAMKQKINKEIDNLEGDIDWWEDDLHELEAKIGEAEEKIEDKKDLIKSMDTAIEIFSSR